MRCRCKHIAIDYSMRQYSKKKHRTVSVDRTRMEINKTIYANKLNVRLQEEEKPVRAHRAHTIAAKCYFTHIRTVSL